nr:hypothetical protein [Halococcus sediminicola]
MEIIDPHMHMVSRSADDYARARRAGIECCIDCLLYTSDAADDMQCVDLGGRRIIKKKKSSK